MAVYSTAPEARLGTPPPALRSRGCLFFKLAGRRLSPKGLGQLREYHAVRSRLVYMGNRYTHAMSSSASAHFKKGGVCQGDLVINPHRRVAYQTYKALLEALHQPDGLPPLRLVYYRSMNCFDDHINPSIQARQARST